MEALSYASLKSAYILGHANWIFIRSFNVALLDWNIQKQGIWENAICLITIF